MTKTDTNLSPKINGESNKKNLAEESKQDKSHVFEVKFNLLKLPNDFNHPIRYRHVDVETANISKPFINLKLIMPVAIYDYYNSELVLYDLDYARAEDYLQDILLDFIANDMKNRSEDMTTEAAKIFLVNIFEQLSKVNYEFLERIPKIIPDKEFTFIDKYTKEKVTIDAKQLHNLIEGELGESFPLDND